MKIKLSKDEIIRLVNENPCEIYYDHYWDYLKEGDNFKTCAMLEMNCNIEKREGFIVHVIPTNYRPNKEDIQKA